MNWRLILDYRRLENGEDWRIAVCMDLIARVWCVDGLESREWRVILDHGSTNELEINEWRVLFEYCGKKIIIS